MANIDSPFTLVTPPTPSKAVFESKTIVINLLIAIGVAVPAVGDWIKAHAQESLVALAILNLILRKITHERISLFGSDA